MAEKRDVDWAAIRKEYETTDISDLALSKRWGFRSGTSITRKRQHEGWTRDLEAVTGVLVTRAIADTAHDPKRHTHTPHTHTAPQQNQASGVEEDFDVCANPGNGPGRSADARAHAQAGETDDVLNTAIDLAAIRSAAIRRQLDAAAEMQKLGRALIDCMLQVATAPVEAGGKYVDARARLTAINAEKDSLSTLMKAASGLLSDATKIERQALGLEAAKGEEEAPAEQRRLRPEDVLPLLDARTLEVLGEAASKAATMRPALTITPTGQRVGTK